MMSLLDEANCRRFIGRFLYTRSESHISPTDSIKQLPVYDAWKQNSKNNVETRL